MADLEKGITITFRGNTASFDASIGNIEKAMKVVQADTKALNKELKLDPTNIDKLTDKMKNLQSLLKLNQEAARQYQKKIREAIAPSEKVANSSEYQKLNQQLREAEGRVASYADQLNKANELNMKVTNPQEWAKLNEKYAKANNELNGINDQMMELIKTDYTVLDWKQYSDGMRQYRQSLGQIDSLMMQIKNTSDKINNNDGLIKAERLKAEAKELTDTSNKLRKLAGDLRYVSLAAGGVLAGAIKSASDFESAWVGVEKVVNETTTTSFADLQEQVKDLARTVPVELNTITEAFANAGQLGVSADNLQEFVETILRLDSATNISADEAATTIAQLYNVMGADLSTVDNFANALVRLGNNSATTEKDILEMASTIAASSRQVGFTESQVLGLADALASAGLNPSSAGTAISQFLTKIDKSLAKNTDSWYKYNKSTKKYVLTSVGTQVKELAKLAGITGKGDKGILANFQKAWQENSSQVFQNIIAGMKEAKDSGQNLNSIFELLEINGIKQDSTLKALINSYPLLADAMEMANDAFENGDDAVKESDKAWETFSSKVEVLKNNLKLLGISLGNTILPALSDIVQKITEVVQWFDGLSPTTKTLITGILGFVAALAPVLSFVSKVLGFVSTIKTALAGIASSGIAVKIVGIFPKILGFLGKIGAWFAKLGPWGVAIGGIIALIVAFKDEFDTLMYALLGAEVWDTIKNTVQGLIDLIGGLLNGILDLIGSILNGFGKAFKWIWEQIQRIAVEKGMKPKTEPVYNAPEVSKQTGNRLSVPVIHSGGLGLAMAGGTNITLSTSINVNNNGTPIDEYEVRRWGNVITDIVSDNLGKRW